MCMVDRLWKMVTKLDFACVLVYVDDILLLSTTKEAEEHVVATLSSVVPVKTTRSEKREDP